MNKKTYKKVIKECKRLRDIDRAGKHNGFCWVTTCHDAMYNILKDVYVVSGLIDIAIQHNIEHDRLVKSQRTVPYGRILP